MWSNSIQQASIAEPLGCLLAHKGLLTLELARIFGAKVSVKKLQGYRTEVGGYRRKVVLMCDLKPMVYAETLIPPMTLDHHKWLADLGDNSLGARMSEFGEIIRSEYEYSLLSPQHELYRRMAERVDLEDSTDAELWSRRFELSLDSHEVQITELFLPACY